MQDTTEPNTPRRSRRLNPTLAAPTSSQATSDLPHHLPPVEDHGTCGEEPPAKMRKVIEILNNLKCPKLPGLRSSLQLESHVVQCKLIFQEAGLMNEEQLEPHYRQRCLSAFVESLREVSEVYNLGLQLLITSDWTVLTKGLIEAYCSRATMKSVLNQEMASLNLKAAGGINFLNKCRTVFHLYKKVYSDVAAEQRSLISSILERLPRFLTDKVVSRLSDVAQGNDPMTSIPFDHVGTDKTESFLSILGHALRCYEMVEEVRQPRQSSQQPRLDKIRQVSEDHRPPRPTYNNSGWYEDWKKRFGPGIVFLKGDDGTLRNVTSTAKAVKTIPSRTGEFVVACFGTISDASAAIKGVPRGVTARMWDPHYQSSHGRQKNWHRAGST